MSAHLLRVAIGVDHDLPIVLGSSAFSLAMVWLFDRLLTKPKISPTPAGSGSDSDMYPGAPSSQSREPGVEPRQGEGDPK